MPNPVQPGQGGQGGGNNEAGRIELKILDYEETITITCDDADADGGNG